MTLVTISTILSELVVYKAFFFHKLVLIPLLSLWNFLLINLQNKQLLIVFKSFECILGDTVAANQN